MADMKQTDIRQKLEQGLREMANLISRREYNLGLVKGRQVMEQIVRAYAGELALSYTDLADTIENLYRKRGFDRGTRDAFHQIRHLGNKAVHEGDNNPQDAEKAYYLLKNEIETFLNRSTEDRTPKRVERSGMQTAARGVRQRAEGDGFPERSGDGQSTARAAAKRSDKTLRSEERIPSREDRLRAQREQKRGGKNRGQRNQGGINVYDLLRILIPLICIILLIIFIKSIIPNGSGTTETTPAETSTAVQTEAPTETEPPTEPETTEPAAVRYRIKGDKVNARYADNQNRVYEQLSSGTEIGEIEEIEGSDFVKFVRDGINLVVNKNYIEPVPE